MLVTIFSVSPATLLYCLSEQAEGPKLRLRLVLFALWSLMIAVVNLGRTTDPSKAALKAGKIGHPFELYCQVIGTKPLDAVRGFALVSAGMGVVWCAYVFYRRFRGSDVGNERRGRVTVAVAACMYMWSFLGVFTGLRARSIEVAGASDKSNEWSFGQIVAVATWAPVIFNFIYALFGRCFLHGVEKEGTRC
jgi:hypothetical protein